MSQVSGARDASGPDGSAQDWPPSRPGGLGGAWRIVAAREIAVKLTDRAWVISTLITTLLLAGSFALVPVLNSRDSVQVVAVTTPEAAAVAGRAAAGALPGLGPARVEARLFGTSAQASAAVRDGVAAAFLVLDRGQWTLLTGGSETGALAAALTAAVPAHVLERNALEAGISLEQLAAGSQLRVVPLDPVTDGPAGQGAPAARVAGVVFAFIFYMSSLVFGMTIAQSVTEEKQSRLAEIIATSVPMSAMLGGKVIGNTVLAFAQTLIYVGIGLAGVSLTGLGELLPSLPLAAWWFLAFFVAGFVALAAMWAVAGSLASRQEDIGYTSSPMMGIVVAVFMTPFLVGGQWLTGVSYMPLVSSVAMPMRIVAGSAAPWEPVVALALTVLAAWGLIRLGARLYRNSLLRTGGRLRYRDALRSAD